jgi:hypothetical protein
MTPPPLLLLGSVSVALGAVQMLFRRPLHPALPLLGTLTLDARSSRCLAPRPDARPRAGVTTALQAQLVAGETHGSSRASMSAAAHDNAPKQP